MWPGLSDYLLSITTGWYSVSRVLGWSNLTLPSGPKYSCKPPVSKNINFKHHNFSLKVVLTFLHSHVFNLNVLHELVDDVLCVYPASVQLFPSLVLLHGAVDAGVGGAWAGVPVVRRVFRAVSAVRMRALLAGLAAVARRALALARCVAGVASVARLLSLTHGM